MSESKESIEPEYPTFLTIGHAAELAGYSRRNFSRIIREEHIRIVQIGRKKHFILGKEFASYMSSRRPKKYSCTTPQ